MWPVWLHDLHVYDFTQPYSLYLERQYNYLLKKQKGTSKEQLYGLFPLGHVSAFQKGIEEMYWDTLSPRGKQLQKW